MIYGIGTDVCDIRRIAATLERQGVRFAAKVLGDAELAIWRTRSARWPKRGRDAADVAHVGADAVDHRDWASLMQRRYSRVVAA